jgi:hypothetical protein
MGTSEDHPASKRTRPLGAVNAELGEKRLAVEEFRLPAPGSQSSITSRKSATWVGGGFIVVLPITLLLLAMNLGRQPLSDSQFVDRTVGSASAPSVVSGAFAAEPSQTEPRLIVHEVRGIAGEPMPLGLTVQGVADGADVIIKGTIPGMTFSSGSPSGRNTWQLVAKGVQDTWVGPPQGFVGVVELTAELRLADGRVVDDQPITREWAPATLATATPGTATDTLAEDGPSLPTARVMRSAEQIGPKKHRKATARAVTVWIVRHGPARPATRHRFRVRPVYRLPTQLTRAFIPGW